MPTYDFYCVLPKAFCSSICPSVKRVDCDKTKQVAQLSQRDRAAGWVSYGQK